jgi:hypothetical protein
MKLGVKQSLASAAVFLAVLLMLVSVDDRVRDRFNEMAYGNGAKSLTIRAGDLGDAVVSAARHQSIENAPLLVFAVGGAVLVVFMVKT